MMRRHLERLADYYDDFQRRIFDYQTEAEIISNVLRENGVKKVVDVGCGTGTHTIRLAQLGYQCTGIDVDKEMLQIARQKAQKEKASVEFAQGDVRDLSSPLLKDMAGMFDASIWLRSTLSLEDEKLALEFQHVLLRDEGLIIHDLLQMSDENNGQETFNMDLITEGKVAVRFNRFNIAFRKVCYEAVYFIGARGVRMVTYSLELPISNIEEYGKVLEATGFQYATTIHSYTGIPGTISPVIVIRKRSSAGESRNVLE